MDFNNIIFEFVLIFAGAALFATAFLFLKQPVILAYIGSGIIAGPWGLGLIKEPEHIEELSHIGVILLLYLLGINLKPDRLFHLFSKTAIVTLSTCLFLMFDSNMPMNDPCTYMILNLPPITLRKTKPYIPESRKIHQ